MPKYMVIYHILRDWPLSGSEEQTKTEFFEDYVKALNFMGDILLIWFKKELKDAQMYEYTGIQYELVERMHADD